MPDKYRYKAKISRALRNCERKVVYETLDDAVKAAEIKNQHVYVCPNCDKWHLTHGYFMVKKLKNRTIKDTKT